MRANELKCYEKEPNGNWKFLNIDQDSKKFVIPKGILYFLEIFSQPKDKLMGLKRFDTYVWMHYSQTDGK
jgi:hypothetical protein